MSHAFDAGLFSPDPTRCRCVLTEREGDVIRWVSCGQGPDAEVHR